MVSAIPAWKNITQKKIERSKISTCDPGYQAEIPILLCTGYSKKVEIESAAEANIKAVLKNRYPKTI